MTLTEVLLARIAEDEAFVQAGIRLRRATTRAALTPRQVAHAGALFDLVLDDPEVVALAQRYGSTGVRAPGEAERIIAECEAKRRIVNRLHAVQREATALDPGDNEEGWVLDRTLSELHAVLRHLALPYAAHPDYRDEWRP